MLMVVLQTQAKQTTDKEHKCRATVSPAMVYVRVFCIFIFFCTRLRKVGVKALSTTAQAVQALGEKAFVWVDACLAISTRSVQERIMNRLHKKAIAGAICWPGLAPGTSQNARCSALRPACQLPFPNMRSVIACLISALLLFVVEVRGVCL